MLEDSRMPTPLDPATLPHNVIALRSLLLQREAEHAAEMQAARNGLMEQVLRNELLKARLAKLLRERFGASSEKLRGAIEQLELLLGDLEEQIAETAPAEPEQPAPPASIGRPRRKPALAKARAGAPAVACAPAARCGRTPRAVRLSAVWRRLAPSGTGCDRGAGVRAGVVPCDPARAAEAVVPVL